MEGSHRPLWPSEHGTHCRGGADHAHAPHREIRPFVTAHELQVPTVQAAPGRLRSHQTKTVMRFEGCACGHRNVCFADMVVSV